MAGTRRPDGVNEKEALFVGGILGFLLGIVAGAFAVSWGT